MPWIFAAIGYKAPAQEPTTKKEEKKETNVITIKKSGDKNADLKIEFKGDAVLINGKPLAEFKDDAITINNKKIVVKNGDKWSIMSDDGGTAFEINGTFDDCQSMVKQAFADADLNNKLSLTSANSINVARWLPQQLYYFFAYQQWQNEEPPVICVPSGNFGNICAGILAHVSGLPVKHFIAACNANDVVTNYIETGEYKTKPSVATISNAMDVGNPSNFIRILEIFHHQYKDLKQVLSSYSVSDEETRQTIDAIYHQYNYTLDPHGAVAYYALEKYFEDKNNGSSSGSKGFILETAHPVKFPDVVEQITGEKIAVPENAKHLFALQKQSIEMNPSFNDFKEWLMNK